MGVQQMMLGIAPAIAPLSVGAPDAVGEVSLTEPAPPNTPVAATSSATASGGSGTYTYSWARVSGSTSITPNSTTTASVSFSATVLKNSTLSAVWRITVNDGLSTATHDITVYLTYTTDL